MDNDLIKISLNQGKQFKNYQKKMTTSIENQIHSVKSKRVYKKKEGFAMPTNLGHMDSNMGMNMNDDSNDLLKQRDERSKSINQANQKDLSKLTSLQTQYNDLQTQYSDAEKKINSNSLVSINRTSIDNPYLNKNITLNQSTTGFSIIDSGLGGYVSGQGLFKAYPDQATFDAVAGKNGCPKVVMPNVTSNDFSSSLIQGQPMVANQSCGNEGKNVYVSQLVNNPTTSYVGCYNDKPSATNINAIPIMNSSNSVNGFISIASSIYLDNNPNYGPWAAFDQNPNTFWHSAYDENTMYEASTGVYKGNHKVNYNSFNSGLLTAVGEYLQIDMPGVNTDSVQNVKVTQYSITPRGDGELFLTRSPNTWHIFGYKNEQWYEVDYQVGQSFTSSAARTFNIASPDYYGSYIILTVKVGNNDKTTLRECVQIAGFDLYVSSDSTFTNDQRAMIYNSSSIGYTTIDNCKKYAIDNNYQYFGLQDLQSDGSVQCLVSNDYDRTVSYGDASKQTNATLLWASNTASGQPYTMQVSGVGKIILYDINTSIIFNSNSDVADCVNWGTLYIDSATYGGNCQVPIGHDTNMITNDCNYKENCSIPISYSTFNDPAPGCAKTFDVAYKCGGKSFSKNLASEAQGQTLILDCKDHIETTCQFVLLLQDDGNMCLYKGKDPSTKTDLIWSSGTAGKQKGINENWAASKGKYGRNYMSNGETLAADEWIGSNDGSIKLIMQKDGNLVLYTSEAKLGCSVKDNKTYGGQWVNAVYKIDQTGNKSSLGKIAYIDGETKLREYPSSLLEMSNQYQLLNNFDSVGNDLQQITSSTKEQGCIDACNANDECAGFVYQPSGSMCYLKNSGMYPVGEKQYYSDSGIMLGVRKPQISSSVNKSCRKDLVNIDSIQYDNYIKGDPMSLDTTCGSTVVLSEDKNILTGLQNSMISIGQQISAQTEKLFKENKNINNKMTENSAQFNKNVDLYKEYDNKIKSELNLPSMFQSENKNVNKNANKNANKNIVINKREGMRTIDTIEKTLTMNDINSMLSDTDIRVLQENYSYIFWSILAVGLLTVTISQIRK